MIKGNMTAVALCAVGAEKAVSNELRKLSSNYNTAIKIEDSLYGRVRFKTDLKGLYQALIGLRAADRVLLEVANFAAADFDTLFEGACAVEWEAFVPKGMGLTIAKVRTNRSQLKAETTIQSMVHKAAAERLCQKHKVTRLPELSINNPVKIAQTRVYIEKNIVSLLLDLSGEPLFKRGYRSEGGAAPLRETTAAGVLLLSGWKRKFPLYDPFCGSGTILIEAAMYAWDMAPGLGRNFAIADMLIADEKIEREVRDEFRAKIDLRRQIRIIGSDEDVRSISIATSNFARLHDIAQGNQPQRGIRSFDLKTIGIDLKVLPFREAGNGERKAESEEAGFILTNPPYGKRLGDQAAAEQIYKDMGSLAERLPKWKLAVITDHSGFESFYGKKADSCREISNGNTPAYFFIYDVI